MKCNMNYKTRTMLNWVPGTWQPIIHYAKNVHKKYIFCRMLCLTIHFFRGKTFLMRQKYTVQLCDNSNCSEYSLSPQTFGK